MTRSENDRRIDYVEFVVADLARARAFYEAAFGLGRRFVHESGDFGEMETGGTALAFSSRKLIAALGKNPAPADYRAPSSEIAFVRPL